MSSKNLKIICWILRRLFGEEAGAKVTLLNFASAKNPCGGMARGALAQVSSSSLLLEQLTLQEESIGLCSGLFCSQQRFLDTFYMRHRKEPRWGSKLFLVATTGQMNIPSFVREGLYSHSMIWSPQIPVFRDDVSLNLTEEVAQSN